MGIATNSRNAIAMNDKDITKTTEFRISTETDLNFNHLQEPTAAWIVPERDRPYGYENV